MTLYHRDVYLPARLPIPNCTLAPVYTVHAKAKAKELKIKLPLVVDVSRDSLIEVEIIKDKAIKAVFRRYFDEKNDMCLVFSFPAMEVITIWLNNITDKHETLDQTRYAKE